MFLRAAIALMLLVVVGSVIGQLFPTFYAIPICIGSALLLSAALQFWIMHGMKQGFIEFIFALPKCCVPIWLRHWAIWNDKDLVP